MTKGRLIGEVESGPNMKVRVTIRKSNKHQYIDIRKFIEDEEYSGPTRKGIRLHPETLEEVLPLIEKGRQELADDSYELDEDKKKAK